MNQGASATSPLHALTWAVWALAAGACVQLAPNPVYVALVIGVVALVVAAHAGDTPIARAFPIIVGVGVAFGVLRVVLTAVTTHGGGDALVTVPAVTLPTILGGFTVGGTIETAVVLQAAAEAFAIVGVMAAFGAFNAVVSHHELVQSAPRAFYEVGLIVTVAVAFVPSIVASVHRVAEADRARTGGAVVVRRGRLLRRTLPLLESGMEQAMALAESMDSRGFGRDTSGVGDRAGAIGALVGLAGLAGAFVALVAEARGVALVLAATGLAGLAGAVVVLSRTNRRSRYRRRPFTRRDKLVAAVTVVAPLSLALLAARGEATLTWAASPLVLPGVSLAAAAAIAALVAPVVVRR